MTDTIGTALLRRHIGRRFVALRKQAGITQEEAAIALQRARATLGRIEEGDERVRFRDVDVKAMLDLYGASEEERKILLALTAETRNGRRKSWWHDYTETALAEGLGLLVTLEDSAETIREYESELVPGLLQIPGYIEQIHRTPPGYLDQEEIERRVELRRKRQEVLTRPRAPHLSAILNEAVLHRPVSGNAVMADQLAHLLEVGQQSNVSIRIVPWSAGAHGGMAAANSFFLLDFPADPYTSEPLEPPLAFVDTLTGSMYLNKPDEVAAYRQVWADLENKALDEAETHALISSAWKGFRDG